MLARDLLRACCLAACLVAVCLAEDFRVESRVYIGKEKDPASVTTTLFRAGVVYDYLNEPDRTAVFNEGHGRFVLLDVNRKIKTEIAAREVAGFAVQLHQRAAKSRRKAVRFLADPSFQVAFEQSKSELLLASPQLSYRVQTQEASPKAAEQYRAFSDWYARLNVMLNPATNLPFARMKLNSELAQRGLVGAQVELTITPSLGTSARDTMRSDHHFAWRLLEKDLARLSETGNQLATFESVSLADYLKVADAKKR